MTKKKIIIAIMLSLTMACSSMSGPSAQRVLDTAEDALTTACESAMFPTTLAKFSIDKVHKIGEACATGGSASLSAQAAYQMSLNVPDAEKADWIQQMQLSTQIIRQVTAEILATIGSKK